MDEMLQLFLAVLIGSSIMRANITMAQGSFNFGAYIVKAVSPFMVSGSSQFMYRALRHLCDRTIPNMLTGSEVKEKTFIIRAGDT